MQFPPWKILSLGEDLRWKSVVRHQKSFTHLRYIIKKSLTAKVYEHSHTTRKQTTHFHFSLCAEKEMYSIIKESVRQPFYECVKFYLLSLPKLITHTHTHRPSYCINLFFSNAKIVALSKKTIPIIIYTLWKRDSKSWYKKKISLLSKKKSPQKSLSFSILFWPTPLKKNLIVLLLQ